tara:strand:- start:328 stop:1161 length:834 start_codon:yes stop_codon:yes gene_type:complete
MEFSAALLIICIFTAIIHFTETLAYSMRLAGVRVKKIAIAMAFVTSTLLISRLSNMIQAPLLGAMVDTTILVGTTESLNLLEMQFRIIILAAFIGTFLGAFMTPTAVQLFQKAILHFQATGSIPRVVYRALKPKNLWAILTSFKFPDFKSLSTVNIKSLPKQFLIINVGVTSIYVIGVLCSLLAGAYLPEFRSTAIQLSGIVNGMATVLFTIFVDPPGARITDQAINQQRPQNDVRSVVFLLQCGKMLGILIFAQLFLRPFSHYIVWVTTLIKQWFV